MRIDWRVSLSAAFLLFTYLALIAVGVWHGSNGVWWAWLIAVAQVWPAYQTIASYRWLRTEVANL